MRTKILFIRGIPTSYSNRILIGVGSFNCRSTFERLLGERRERTELYRVGKNSERVAWNEVTTRAAGGRHGAADSFSARSKHTHDARDCSVLCGLARGRGERRVVRFSRGGIFHLHQPPLDAPAAPAPETLSLFLAHYTSLRHPCPVPSRRRRLCRNAYTWSRYRARARAHAHATLTITITKKRGNASGKMTRRRSKELLWSEGVKRADTWSSLFGT